LQLQRLPEQDLERDNRGGNRMAKIFISYSRQSEAMAKSLVTDFESLGHDVWFDRELSGGQAWWDQILAMIRDCIFSFSCWTRKR
jgi:TIR domain